MSKPWFNRLLISYLPIFLVIFFSISICFFLFVNYTSQQQAKHANELFVDQVMLKLDQTLKRIDSEIMREVTFNGNLKAFYDDQKNDIFAGIIQPSQELQEFLTQAPEIDTIYLYRKDKDLVLSQNIVSDLANYGDQAFIRDMIKQGGATQWLPVRGFREFSDDNYKNVITLIRKVPILTGEKGFVVVNVNTETLKRTIKEMSLNPLSEIRVKDQNGTSFVDSASPAFTSLVVSKSSSYTGWEYDIVLKDLGFFHVFYSLHIVWIFVTLLLMFLGILWIAYVSRNQYKPIEAIMRQIRSVAMPTKQSAPSAGKDEFLFIQTAVTRLIEQSSEYLAKHKADLVYRKRQLFLDLMEGIPPAYCDEWMREMNEFQMPPDYQSLLISVVEIDKFPEFEVKYGYRDQSLFKFVLKSVAVEISEKYGLWAWPEWVENDRLAVLFFIKGPINTDVATLCGEVVSWVNEHLRFTVTIGIGSLVEQLEEVSTSFEESITALKYKSVLGYNRHITYSDIHSADEHQVYDLLHGIRQIVQMFIQGDTKWEDAFDRFMNGLKEGMMSKDDIVVAMNYLNYYFNHSMKELAPEYRVQWEQSVYPSLLVAMDQYETLEEVKKHYIGLLSETFQNIGSEREKRRAYSLIRQVRQFIDEHYTNPELSLNYIGEHFVLNIKSLSQMFKEELGEKFVDYLAGLRIQRARQLLEETDLSVQEIADRVGYQNVHTFNRVFKKVMNVTPGDYRKQRLPFSKDIG
jgi:AraC-like DNA-binding protein